MFTNQFFYNVAVKLIPIIFFLSQNLYSNINKHDGTDFEKHNHSSLMLTCYRQYESNYLGKDFLKRACHHRAKWIQESKSKEYTKNKVTKNQLLYLSRLETKHISKIFYNKTRSRRDLYDNFKKRLIRKEYRMLNDHERERLHYAMNQLKKRMIDNITLWDLHILIHYPDSAPGAHWGAAFLPWHREFLKQFENALQNIDSRVTLPYWDSTLDHGLPEPSDSIIWSDKFFGNGNGYVRTGPFKDWTTNVFMPLSNVKIKKLYRYTGGKGNERLLSPDDVDWILKRDHYSNLTFCHDRTFESMHGLSHVWVGGFMYVIRVSPNDPAFYLHHGFIDNIWERFRQLKQSRREREIQYAENTCGDLHLPYAQMKPFSLTNIDGLSNDYTDYYYTYQNVKHCSPSDPVCYDSPYYWCDKNEWRCKSKIQLGGNCSSLEGQDSCYNSMCFNGKCQTSSTFPYNNIERLELIPSNVLWGKSLLLDNENKPITHPYAQVINVDDDYNFNVTTYIEQKPKDIEYNGIIYLALPKISSSLSTTVTFKAKDQYGRYCQSYCINETTQFYDVCEPKITLKIRKDMETANIPYTHSYISRSYLNVDLSAHPSILRIMPPYIVFSCHSKVTDGQEMFNTVKNMMQFSKPLDDYVWFRVQFTLINESSFDMEKLMVKVIDTDDSYYNWEEKIQKVKSPMESNIIFVKAPNPFINGKPIIVRILILYHGQILTCIARCTKYNERKKSHCSEKVMLHYIPYLGDENIFTSNEDILNLIGWKMIGHPSKWDYTLPYLSLVC
uniref:Tyrosinase_Cu-bd domain-containing protein n=1 Tax=Strongyloides venezuelensis TaxID=75913 RepID=A0A0K0FIL8_STRVS